MKGYKCPNCKKTINKVVVYSQCSQVANIFEDGTLDDFRDTEIGITLYTNCYECNEEIVLEEQ